MDELTRLFEIHRDRLRTIAFRILGSATDAEDAVQETWLRLHRSGAAGIDDLGAWLTTVTSRICLNMLRARTGRKEDSLGERLEHAPEPTVSWVAGPEEGAHGRRRVLGAQRHPRRALARGADRVRLRDVFGIPFRDIAPTVGRTSEATRQLASRARRRIRGAAPPPVADLGEHQRIVRAFFAAADEGDVAGLVGLLDPEVVQYADFGGDRGSVAFHGPDAVARNAARYATVGRTLLPVIVAGVAGVVIEDHGRITGVMSFPFVDGRIVEIEAFADPEQLARVAATMSEEERR